MFQKKVITTNLSIMKEISKFYSNLYFVDFDFLNLREKILDVISSNNKIYLNFNENNFSWLQTRKIIADSIRKI